MLPTASLDALQRIADRAHDVLAAYTPGAVPRFGDVASAARSVPDDNPLSVAAPAGSWFVTQGERGARTYTRAGTFHIGGDGTLQSLDGSRVLGSSESGVLEPIRLPEADRALGRCTDVRIEDDGAVAYTRASIDPRTRERSAERIVSGRVALARFPAGSNPQRIDATQFSAAAGVVPHVGTAGAGGFGPLTTHARDLGRIDLDLGLQRLSDAYVAFSALQAANKAQGESAKITLDLVK